MLNLVGDLHPVATLAYDERFQIVDANSAAELMTGYARDELIGVNGIELLHRDDRGLAACVPNSKTTLSAQGPGHLKSKPEHHLTALRLSESNS